MLETPKTLPAFLASQHLAKSRPLAFVVTWNERFSFRTMVYCIVVTPGMVKSFP